MGDEIAPEIAPEEVQDVKGADKKQSYKNLLQEVTQKALTVYPVYETVNEGGIYKPMFRSTVKFDGKSFTTANTFAQRKAAEQDVARVAFEEIYSNSQQDGELLIHKYSNFCKSMLHEYADMMTLKFPTYTTAPLEGKLPSFTTTVEFDGKTYTGCSGRNKKAAEQLGALAVIESIIGTSETRLSMYEIIKSKSKLFSVTNETSAATLMSRHAVAVEEQPADPAPSFPLITMKEEIPCLLPSVGNGRTLLAIPQCDVVVGSENEQNIPEMLQHGDSGETHRTRKRRNKIRKKKIPFKKRKISKQLPRPEP